jgi:hypothetical protein
MQNEDLSTKSKTSELTSEQINLLERNLSLSVDDRINQLQSAIELIEEMRNSLKVKNEN